MVAASLRKVFHNEIIFNSPFLHMGAAQLPALEQLMEELKKRLAFVVTACLFRMQKLESKCMLRLSPVMNVIDMLLS